MRAPVLLALLFALAGCGGAADITKPDTTHAKPKALDPFLTIRIRNQLDTTTAAGRSQWHIYELLTGPYDSQNGIAFQGSIDLVDIRLGHSIRCGALGADSVGQRLLTVLAVADTTVAGDTPDPSAFAIVTAWYNGNHVLPSGWMALTFTPVDAFVSEQFTAGHGLVPTDPIKWGFDWTAGGTTSFYERTDTDASCSTFP